MDQPCRIPLRKRCLKDNIGGNSKFPVQNLSCAGQHFFGGFFAGNRPICPRRILTWSLDDFYNRISIGKLIGINSVDNDGANEELIEFVWSGFCANDFCQEANLSLFVHTTSKGFHICLILGRYIALSNSSGRSKIPAGIRSQQSYFYEKVHDGDFPVTICVVIVAFGSTERVGPLLLLVNTLSEVHVLTDAVGDIRLIVVSVVLYILEPKGFCCFAGQSRGLCGCQGASSGNRAGNGVCSVACEGFIVKAGTIIAPIPDHRTYGDCFVRKLVCQCGFTVGISNITGEGCGCGDDGNFQGIRGCPHVGAATHGSSSVTKGRLQSWVVEVDAGKIVIFRTDGCLDIAVIAQHKLKICLLWACDQYGVYASVSVVLFESIKDCLDVGEDAGSSL